MRIRLQSKKKNFMRIRAVEVPKINYLWWLAQDIACLLSSLTNQSIAGLDAKCFSNQMQPIN